MADRDLSTCFAGVYSTVQSLNYEVEALPAIALKEDARKVARLAKRVSLVLSDLQPYVAPDASPALCAVLQEIETSLSMMFDTVTDMAAKGPLATFLQADHMLTDFQAAAAHLEEALGAINGRLPEETAEELSAVRSLLARTRFELQPEHSKRLDYFRSGVDAMVSAHKQLLDACSGILGDITGKPGVPLTTEAYEVTLKELIGEHTTLLRRNDPYGDALYIRTMIDVLRLQHKPSAVPPAFCCPLTHQVMKDPVVLQETGQSYERKAIENWYASGHRICPRSGQKLGWRLHLVPNSTMQEAIQEWLLHGALATSWQPLLATLTLEKPQAAAAAEGEEGKGAAATTTARSVSSNGRGAIARGLSALLKRSESLPPAPVSVTVDKPDAAAETAQAISAAVPPTVPEETTASMTQDDSTVDAASQQLAEAELASTRAVMEGTPAMSLTETAEPSLASEMDAQQGIDAQEVADAAAGTALAAAVAGAIESDAHAQAEETSVGVAVAVLNPEAVARNDDEDEFGMFDGLTHAGQDAQPTSLPAPTTTTTTSATTQQDAAFDATFDQEADAAGDSTHAGTATDAAVKQLVADAFQEAMAEVAQEDGVDALPDASHVSDLLNELEQEIDADDQQHRTDDMLGLADDTAFVFPSDVTATKDGVSERDPASNDITASLHLHGSEAPKVLSAVQLEDDELLAPL